MKAITLLLFFLTFSLNFALFAQNSDALDPGLKETIFRQSEKLQEQARKVENLADYQKILEVACGILNENMDNKPLLSELQKFMFLIINADPDKTTSAQKQTVVKYLKAVGYLGFEESIWLDSIGSLDEILKDERVSMDPIAKMLIKAKHGDAEALSIIRDKVKNAGFFGEKIDYEKAYGEQSDDPDFDIKLETWFPRYWDALYVGTPDLVDAVIESFFTDNEISQREGFPPIHPAYEAIKVLPDAIVGFPNSDMKNMFSSEYLGVPRNWIRQNRSSIKLKKRIPFPSWRANMPENIDSLK